MFPYAPAIPAIWPLTRFFTSGTMANTAPSPDWTKNEQTMHATTASAHGHAAPIVDEQDVAEQQPTITTVSVRRREPSRSDMIPPAGRAARFMNANADAAMPGRARPEAPRVGEEAGQHRHDGELGAERGEVGDRQHGDRAERVLVLRRVRVRQCRAVDPHDGDFLEDQQPDDRDQHGDEQPAC